LPAEGPFRGLLLAALLTALAFAVHLGTYRNPLGHYDRTRLPGFDAYVYVAMAEHPGVFTLPPWGYRILTPWVVAAAARDPAAGFLRVAVAGLGLAVLLLYVFLRRLGLSEVGALVGVSLFALCPPVAEALHYRFLSEPLCVLLEVGLLLALEARPDLGLLAVIGVLGVLAKEEFLLFLPVVYLARPRDGLLRAILACLPALLGYLVLRRVWAPLPALPAAPVTMATFWLAVYRILAQWGDWWSTPLCGGLLLLNGLALARPSGRSFLARFGFVEAVAIGVAFAASVYTDDAQNVPFFAADVPRLLIYAVPVALAAGGAALAGERPVPSPARVAPILFGAAVGLALLPLLTQDSYRRADLRGPRDGRIVLAFCRESLAFAERLGRGKPVDYEIEARRFPSVGGDPRLLDRMRWFLRGGFGPRPQYGTGPVVLFESPGTLVVPCLRPAPWTLVFQASAAQPVSVAVRLNGHPLPDLHLDGEPRAYKAAVDPAFLFKGDNALEVDAPLRGVVELHDLRINPRSEE
jgi:hypothetical protein